MRKRGMCAAVIIVVAAAVLAAAGACGSENSGRGNLQVAQPIGGLEINQPDGLTAAPDPIAELNALPCPDGVDAALWAELKGALETQLSQSRPGSPARLLGSKEQDGHGMPCPYKSTATPPTGEANRVDDLGMADNGDGSYTLTWHYRNLGDYGQDGTVGIEDITPLAQHFGETYVPITDPNSIQAVIDGSGNGKVGIEDVTPIAVNFGVEVADYLIEGATALEGPFSEVEAVPVEEATGAASGRARFAHIFTPGEYAYFRITARDAEGTRGEPSNTVGLALQILSVTPTEVKEGTVVTFSAEILGAGPLSYEWDFGGGAQYETYTEPAPRVVLTRDTGGFPASLTVTGPLGNVSFPFTLSKLPREWKYEVVLANPDGSIGAGDLQEHDGKLWFYAYQDYNWSTGDAAQKWIVSGTPGSWHFEQVEAMGILRLSREGSPGIAWPAGPFLNKTLTLWEKRDGVWTKDELLSSGVVSHFSFTYSGEGPFMTFKLPNEPNNSWVEYFWRKDAGWERGVADEPGYVVEVGLAGVCSIADPQGNPAMCYSAYVETPEGTHLQFRVGWWDDEADNWEIIPVESSWENGGVTCGLFPALSFRPDGRLAVTFARFSPDLANDQLAYAIYDGSSWQKELVEELPDAGTTNQYSYKALKHDPYGNPLIAFAHVTKTDDVRDCCAWAYFFNGVAWDKYVLDESGVAESAPSAVFDQSGNPYVLFADKVSKEVVIAYYE